MECGWNLNFKSLQVFGRGGARNGAVAIIVAICLLPILTVAGAAIDYSFASFRETTLQRTADSAALAGAALIGATTAQAEAIARTFFLGNDPLQVTPTVSVNAETVTVSATYSQPTFLLHAVGTDQTIVGARAVARRGTS